jgi:hypothetical protein
MDLMKEFELKTIIHNYIDRELKVIDFHTHLFPKSFKEFNLFGIENILNYHYLHAEFLKLNVMSATIFFSLSDKERAEQIWEELFVKRVPFSEATKGVLTILKSFNISSDSNYDILLDDFQKIDSKKYISTVYKLSNISKVVMTNDIFDIEEVKYYNNLDRNNFYTSIRLDTYFSNEVDNIELNGKVYDLSNNLELYLSDVVDILKPLYFAISVDDNFSIGDEKYTFLEKHIFPLSIKYNIPISLMIGVKRKVNPTYGLAGDAVVNYDLKHLERILLKNQEITFCLTMLSRENQYESTVLSRKFQNLILFGNWWFLNNDIFINEITRMRMNLLGSSFIPQHSDARVLEHLIYKWKHTSLVFKDILFDYFSFLSENNYKLSKKIIETTIDHFYNGEVRRIIKENKCIT